MSIFPYVYHMVESFHVTDDDRKIALYAGLITSSFTFAEFSAGMFWGRLSDRMGRRPVLIMGLIGTAISMMLFGFASNFPTALAARALGGILNGNAGVLQTTVAEIVTTKEHQPRAYSIMPFVWCLGSILGPALGGLLSQPCDKYPTLFLRHTVFDRFPFLLPNLACVFILVCGVVIGLIFLEETHPQKKHRRRRVLALSRWWCGKWWGCRMPHATAERTANVRYLADDHSRAGSTSIHSLTEVDDIPDHGEIENRGKGLSGRPPKPFTRQVVYNIISYGVLA
jgi:MFS family permease